MRKWLICLTVVMAVLFLSSRAHAQQPDDVENYQDPDDWTETKDAPPQASSTCFVANPTQFEHDCLFRTSGPIVINVPVTRYVGDVDQLLAGRGGKSLIHKKAVVRISAFDVDFNELDSVYVNGHPTDPVKLEGDNCIWSSRAYELPVEFIKFPDRGTDGQAPTPEDNEIRIVIDTFGSQPRYCTAIDWVSIEIKVASPLVLIHGAVALDHGEMFTPTWRPSGQSEEALLPDLGLPVDESYDQGFELNLIETNAAAIGSTVAKVKTETGTDKVSLIMHSKGGIDGRAFVDNGQGEIVDKFVQLGTPNGGLPWIDGILAGVKHQNPANLLLLPGAPGAQLSTDAMSIFNLFHGIQSGPSYTAVAGDHDPACTWCLQRLMLMAYGPGDVWVPIWSAHELGGAEKPTKQGYGPNGDNMYHAYLSSSPRILNEVFVPKVATFASRIGTTNTEYNGIQYSVPWDGAISAGYPDSTVIAVDHDGMTSIGLFYPLGTFDLTLRSPTGQVYTRNSVLGSPSVGWSELPITGGQLGAFTFEGPTPGLWTAVVTPDSIGDPSGTERVALQAWYVDPDLRMDVALRRAAVTVGDTLLLNATLTRSSAHETGAAVTGFLSINGGTESSFALLDNGSSPDSAAGDGIYTARIVTSQAGQFGIRVWATGGGGSTPLYSRAVGTLAVVSQGKIAGTPTIRSYRAVQNSSGFSKWLQVEMDVTIPATGTYRLYAELIDGGDQTTVAHAETLLTAGARTARFRFAGTDLFAHRQNGPWTLRTLRIAQVTNGLLAPVGEWTDCHQTSAYLYSNFQRPPIRLSGTIYSQGADTQPGTPGYEFLDVSVGLEVDYPGQYQWAGSLADNQGNEIGVRGQFEGHLSYQDTLVFRFGGSCIRRNGLDGPYVLKEVVISRPDNPALFVDTDLETSYHAADGFTQFGTSLSSAWVEDDSLTMCPAGDLEHLRMKVYLHHGCPSIAVGQAPAVVAKNIYNPEDARIWDDPTGDSLFAYDYRVGAVKDTALFEASAISVKCVFPQFMGQLDFNYYVEGTQVTSMPGTIKLTTMDLSPSAWGSVDRFDSTAYASINSLPSPTECSNFNFDATVTASEDSLFQAHLVHRHHIPRLLTSPNGGEWYKQADVIPVRWRPGFGAEAKVLVRLTRDGTTDTTVVALDDTDDGVLDWSVPSSLKPGVGYRAEVVHTAGVYSADWRDVGRDRSDTTFVVRPRPVTSLVASGGRTTAALTWTEIGQAGGQADEYEIRYHVNTAITEANFSSGALVQSPPSPGPGGTVHCLEIDSLTSCQTYSFAIRTKDNGAVSLISNVAGTNTPCSGSSFAFCDGGGLMVGGGGGGGEEESAALGLASALGDLQAVGVSNENSLLWWDGTGLEVTDLQRIATGAGAEPSYPVTVREIERRRTQLDQMRLGAVDHAPGRLAIAGAGQVVVGTPGSSLIAQGSQGPIRISSETPYLARSGEVLEIELGRTTANRALVVEARRPLAGAKTDSLGIRVERQLPDGSWVQAALVHPRREFDKFAIPAEGSPAMRITFLGSYPIRAVEAIDEIEVVTPTTLALADAAHSRLGTITPAVRDTGGTRTSLVPGDSLALAFTATEIPSGMVRSLFVVAKGSYERIDGEQESDARADQAVANEPILEFSLGAAFPNPSDGTVTIAYTLARQVPTVLRVYNVAGREVRTLVDQEQTAGRREALWDGRDNGGRRVSSGVYFYRLQAGPWRSERKLIVIQ